MEGLNLGGQYYVVEEPKRKISIPRLIWDIAVGGLALGGAVLGSIALYEQRKGPITVDEPYGLSGLVANGSRLYPDSPAEIMPAPYPYGMHGKAEVSFAAWFVEPDDANCQLYVPDQKPQDFTASKKANISFSVKNPTDYLKKAQPMAICSGGSKLSTIVFEAVYHADGKTAREKTALYYQPA
jgi:hypothetical protein